MSNNALDCQPVQSGTFYGACQPFTRAASWLGARDRETEAACAYALIKSAPDVRSQDVELPDTSAVDVVVLWGRTILHATHLQQSASFSVGCSSRRGERCDFFMPSEVLGDALLTLLEFRAGAPVVLVPAQFGGYLEQPGQARRDLSTLRTRVSGRASQIELPIVLGSRVCLTLGEFSFQFATVRAGKPIAREPLPATDREALAFFGASLLAVASFVACMAYFVPTQNGMDEMPFDEDQIVAMTQYLHAAAEQEHEFVDSPQASNEASRDTEGGTGTRAKYEEGKMGDPTSRASNGRHAIRGPSDNPDSHVSRERLLWEAQHEAMIGLLTSGIAGDPQAPTAPWGRDEALGRDPISADGNMWGDNLGAAFGMHGLGITGIGQGGGGLGEGIGLGDIGGLGDGAGLGSGQGFGVGKGNLGNGNHKVRGPRMRPGVTAISGRLPPEVIQRIVRQNYGRFRGCYELGLAHNPNLEGRVQARFIIGRDGAVSNAHNGESDLPDPSVVSCVISAFYGLNFPEPDGGIVTVAYPIMFQPG